MENYPIELKWEEPGSYRSDSLAPYDKVLRKVAERPGEWARIRVMRQGSAYSTRKRLQAKMRESEPRWQFKVGRVQGATGEELDEMRSLYARLRTDEQMEDETEGEQ